MGSSQSTYIDIYYKNEFLYKKVVTGSSLSIQGVPLTEITKLNFTEKEWEEIKKKKELEIDFCLVDNNLNSIEECIGLFNKTNNDNVYIKELDQFRVVKSNTPCNSIYFRPGSIVKNENLEDMINKVTREIITGKKCKIIFQDYNYNDNDLKRCCYENNKKECNANLINNYETNHCNVIMLKECNNTPENPNCITWLENTHKRNNDLALDFYSKKCKENHDQFYCDYLCKVARKNKDYRSEYCDISLKNWCKYHQYNSNCNCLFTPSDIIPELEEYLGPKVCWLSACSSQNNSKWLTTEQLETRQKCALTSCIININSLNLNNNATASLINDCISGAKISSTELYALDEDNINIEKNNFKGILFSPEILILFFSLTLLLTFVLK